VGAPSSARWRRILSALTPDEHHAPPPLSRPNPPIDDTAWEHLRAHSPLLRTFLGDDAARLRERADAFLRTKGIDAAGGAVVADRERQLIAALAAIPILGLGIDWYDAGTR